MDGLSAGGFLTAAQVKARYGHCSDMWLWRRMHEPGSTFPRPILIQRRRFWRLNDLIRWEMAHVQKASAK